MDGDTTDGVYGSVEGDPGVLRHLLADRGGDHQWRSVANGGRHLFGRETGPLYDVKERVRWPEAGEGSHWEISIAGPASGSGHGRSLCRGSGDDHA